MDNCVWFEETNKSCVDPSFDSPLGCEVVNPENCFSYIKVTKQNKDKVKQKLLKKFMREKRIAEKNIRCKSKKE